MARPTETPIRKVFSISQEMEAAVKDYWHSRRLTSESQAIRALVEAGLKAALADEAATSPKPKRKQAAE